MAKSKKKATKAEPVELDPETMDWVVHWLVERCEAYNRHADEHAKACSYDMAADYHKYATVLWSTMEEFSYYLPKSDKK